MKFNYINKEINRSNSDFEFSAEGAREHFLLLECPSNAHWAIKHAWEYQDIVFEAQYEDKDGVTHTSRYCYDNESLTFGVYDATLGITCPNIEHHKEGSACPVCRKNN